MQFHRTVDWQYVLIISGQLRGMNRRTGAGLMGRYEMRREAQMIIPGLYLGPFQSATKLPRLQQLGITHMCVISTLYPICMFTDYVYAKVKGRGLMWVDYACGIRERAR